MYNKEDFVDTLEKAYDAAVVDELDDRVRYAPGVFKTLTDHLAVLDEVYLEVCQEDKEVYLGVPQVTEVVLDRIRVSCSITDLVMFKIEQFWQSSEGELYTVYAPMVSKLPLQGITSI